MIYSISEAIIFQAPLCESDEFSFIKFQAPLCEVANFLLKSHKNHMRDGALEENETGGDGGQCGGGRWLDQLG